MNSSPTSYRVLHLPTSVGGNSIGLSQSMQKLGVSSETWIFQQNYLNYRCSNVIWLEGDNVVLREMKRLRAIFQTAARFDIIHFNYGSGWASPIPAISSGDKGILKKLTRFCLAGYLHVLSFMEFSLYRALGRRMFVHYQGDDARQGDFSRLKFQESIAQYVEDGYYSEETDKLKRRMIRRMLRYCSNVYAVNPDLIYVLGSKAKFIPYSHISLDEWQPVYNQMENRPLRIGHAPTSRKVKGTDMILTALKQLAAEGYSYELELIENLPNDKARVKYEQVDVFIDQLHAGWYGGVAVEAMALGKPVMVYVREEDLQFVPPEMANELPFLQVTSKTLKEDLRRVMRMPRVELLELAKRSRRYVERWHDPLSIAERVKRDYEMALGR